MIAFVSTAYVPTFFRGTVFCSVREGHKHLHLRSNLTRQSAKPPARFLAFCAGLMID